MLSIFQSPNYIQKKRYESLKRVGKTGIVVAIIEFVRVSPTCQIASTAKLQSYSNPSLGAPGNEVYTIH